MASAASADIAFTTTIIVNTTADELNDDGDCSLREAVQAANTDNFVDACTAGSGDDTIELPAGTYMLALGDAREDANASGDLDFMSNVTLLGADTDTTIIDGNQLDRVLHIHAGASVELANLTIASGKAPDGEESGCGDAGDAPCPGGNGGGVLNEGMLLLRHSLVINNTAGDGGARSWEEEENSGGDGGYGGGLYNNGSLTVVNTSIVGNRSGSGGTGYLCCATGGYGGGIANAGTVSLIDSVVEENTTGRGGFFYGGPTAPQGQGGDGGGIFNAGTASMNQSMVRNNTTRGGYGGYWGPGHSGSGAGIANTGMFTLTSSTVSGNTTADGGQTGSIHGGGYDGGDGGGIFNTDRLVLEGSTVSANATGSGGDGSCGGPGDGGDGGGIANHGALILRNSTVSCNHSGNGGAAICWSDETQGNGGDGGGIYNQGSIEANNSIVAGNDSSSAGGGFVFGAGGPYRIVNLTLVGNRASGHGGGIAAVADVTIDVINTLIVSNIGLSGMGARDASGAQFFLSYCDTFGNSPDGTEGVTIVRTNCVGTPPEDGLDPQLAGGSLPVGMGPEYAQAWLTYDYRLQSGSPAVDAASNVDAPAADFEGDPRPLDGDLDDISIVDIGADEFEYIPTALEDDEQPDRPVQGENGIFLPYVGD
jgi:CSLREA domain-containing protein